MLATASNHATHLTTDTILRILRCSTIITTTLLLNYLKYFHFNCNLNDIYLKSIKPIQSHNSKNHRHANLSLQYYFPATCYCNPTLQQSNTINNRLPLDNSYTSVIPFIMNKHIRRIILQNAIITNTSKVINTSVNTDATTIVIKSYKNYSALLILRTLDSGIRWNIHN